MDKNRGSAAQRFLAVDREPVLASPRQWNPPRVSAITLFYSALSFAMGIGLWLEKRWAEYLTAFVAASFIPFELDELLRHFRGMTDLILTINIVTVIYLIGKLREGRGTSRQTT